MKPWMARPRRSYDLSILRDALLILAVMFLLAVSSIVAFGTPPR